MDRRKALVAAATTAMTISAGALALAANLGLLTHAEGDSVGKLNAKNVAELLDTGKGTTSRSIRVVLDDPSTTVAPSDQGPPPVVGDDAGERSDPRPPATEPQTPPPAGEARGHESDDAPPTFPPVDVSIPPGGWPAPTAVAPTTAAPRATTTAPRSEDSTSTTVPSSTTTEPRDDHDD